VRVGDHERREATDRLTAHAAAGRLSLDELEERVERVHAAVYSCDLLEVEADLPGPQPRRGPRRPPPVLMACLIAAVLASVIFGHPIAPLLIVTALGWRARRRHLGVSTWPERSLR
jgi:hypothetical protein